MGCAFPSPNDAGVLAVKRMALTDVAATVLSSADYMVMPWKDGGATTTEIAPWPPPESATAYPVRLSLGSDLACPSVAWRVSIADIAASCAFRDSRATIAHLSWYAALAWPSTLDNSPRSILLTIRAVYLRARRPCAAHCSMARYRTSM